MARRGDRPEWNRRKPTLREARLVAHEDVGEGVRRMVFSLARWEGEAPEPGQFLMLAVSRAGDPLLFRPFGFSSFGRRVGGAEVEIWFRVAGRGTGLMAQWAVGDHVAWHGPLGAGFPLPGPKEPAVLVAGGIGLPPLLFLARALSARGAGGSVTVLYGAKTRRALAGVEALREAGAETVCCTEDGSFGEKGVVTSLLAGRDLSSSRLFACGPAPMLAAVRRATAGRCRSLHLSLEARMACGFGVCAGCAVPAAPPPGWAEGSPYYLRVCKEGPVFDAERLTNATFEERPGAPPPCGCKP
jgi:dihydroorotate dehydrogenase electron transfer subunit